MHKKLKYLSKYKIVSRDGDIGKISDFYFDEKMWTIRYIVVNTGGWLIKNLVLVSPVFVDTISDDDSTIKVSLTKQQVEDSPDIDSAKPISRQNEIKLSLYYGAGFYWTGYNTWGVVPMPVDLRGFKNVNQDEEYKSNDEETYLRSMNEVLGYHIQAEDGEIGHFEDIVINKDNWSVDYFVLNTKNILPGKNVDVSIKWIKNISWDTKKVYVNLSKKLIEASAGI
jgi:uncharacterized protein YrrD